MEKLKKSSLYYRDFVLIMAFMLVFRGIIDNYISIFQYIDEVVAIGGFLVILVWLIQSKNKSKDLFFSIILVVILLILGLLSSYYAGLQTNYVAIAIDILSIFKFFPIFWGGIIISRKYSKRYMVWKKLSGFVRAFVFVGILFAIINLFFDIGMSTDIRYGLRCFNFVFSRVGGLYTSCVYFLMIQVQDIHYTGNSRKKEKFLILTVILMMSTLRARAFAFAVMFIVGYLIFVKKKKYKFKLWHLMLLIIVLVVVAYPQIRYYLLDNETQSRSRLLMYGVETAKTYFPLGSGFATYGTDVTRTYGSVLYDIYNFSSYYGLGRVHTAYLTDSYWPALMGQFGFIGAGVMGINFILLTKFIIRRLKNRNISLFAVLYQWFAILGASIATASVVTQVAGFFLMAIAISDTYTTEEYKDESCMDTCKKTEGKICH